MNYQKRRKDVHKTEMLFAKQYNSDLFVWLDRPLAHLVLIQWMLIQLWTAPKTKAIENPEHQGFQGGTLWTSEWKRNTAH